MNAIRLGVDIGGTFTDITVMEEDSGRVTISKVPSRRGDPAGALIDAVERGLVLAKVDAARVSLLVHGTTLITNAVLEHKLPKAALLTTEGFRDVLEIGRHFRPDMYDLLQDKPLPVIPRERRFCVAERTAADGEVLKEVDHDAVQGLFDAIRDSGAEAIAICFLNSYVNPANESLAKDWLRQGLPGIHVSASQEVCREIREFERMSTVALNAAAMPLVTRYLEELTPRIRAVLPNAQILLMQSNGGSLTIGAAQDYPVRLITSGPAGGALAVQRIGKATDRDAEHRIEDAKRQPKQQADLEIGDLQILADRFDKQRKDLTVEEREHIGDRQHHDDIPAVHRRWVSGPPRIRSRCLLKFRHRAFLVSD